MPLRTFQLTVAYDGSAYAGWLRQSDEITIQGELERALAPLAGGARVVVSGAGRTDAGVHALGQVASCRLDVALTPADFVRAINARLPPDIRVLDAADRPETFHARFSATAKTYRYHVLNAPVCDPFGRRYVWHVRPPLDMAAMKHAMAPLAGTHDFKAFQATGSRVSTSVRTMTGATVLARPWAAFPGGDPGAIAAAGDAARLVTFELRATGFLRHMVRAIVGTLVEVGLGRRPPDDIPALLREGTRDDAGATAPPQGLVLLRVEYEDMPPASVAGAQS